MLSKALAFLNAFTTEKVGLRFRDALYINHL